jgi:RimJ/RimL family protein N-acetyltransferase
MGAQFIVSMFMLETDRLQLRQMTLHDIDSLYLIFSDPVAMQFYPSVKDKIETKKWIEKNLARYKKDGFGLWAVVRKDNGECIGDCGITMQCIYGEEKPEIGYHIRRDYWGKGYATEAARACKDYAFNVLHIDEVYSYMKTGNLASRKVVEKIGMVLQVGCLENSDTVVYSIKNNNKIL